MRAARGDRVDLASATERRAAIAQFLAALVMSPQMRDETLDAIEDLAHRGHGTLVLNVPKSQTKPIDGAVVTGGLVARFVEQRELS